MQQRSINSKPVLALPFYSLWGALKPGVIYAMLGQNKIMTWCVSTVPDRQQLHFSPKESFVQTFFTSRKLSTNDVDQWPLRCVIGSDVDNGLNDLLIPFSHQRAFASLSFVDLVAKREWQRGGRFRVSRESSISTMESGRFKRTYAKCLHALQLLINNTLKSFLKNPVISRILRSF